MINDKMNKLNISLPKAPDPVGAYVAYKKIGNLLFISGPITTFYYFLEMGKNRIGNLLPPGAIFSPLSIILK